MKQVVHVTLALWAAALLDVVKKPKKSVSRTSRRFTWQRFKWRLQRRHCEHCETSVYIVCVCILWEAEPIVWVKPVLSPSPVIGTRSTVMTLEWYDGIAIPQGKLQRNSIIYVVPPTCYNSEERWATLKTIRGLWLNSNLKGYKWMIRQQQPLWCTAGAGTDRSCTTGWVGSLFVGWMIINVRIFYFQRGLFLWCVVVGSIHLFCFLPPAALFLKHSLGDYPKIIPLISKLN